MLRARRSHGGTGHPSASGYFSAAAAENLRMKERDMYTKAKAKLSENMKAKLSRGHASQNATQAWFATARTGYCAKTKENADRMKYVPSCTRSSQGILGPMPRQLWKSWETAAARCIRLCAACQNCYYVSLSLEFQDCSWYTDCPMSDLPTDVAGFKSGPVEKASAARTRPSRQQRQRWWTPNEVGSRYAQIARFAARRSYNLSSFDALLEHPELQKNLWRGVRLHPSGKRWSQKRLERHAASIYTGHVNQTRSEWLSLQRRYSAKPLVGRVKVMDLLLLLHFTIDHTDTILMYTSQLIHCFQVFHAVTAFIHSFSKENNAFHETGGTPAQVAQYARDMKLAALIHDLGKSLTLFGEADKNVDCMNRVRHYPEVTELDGLEFEWNHDEFGYARMVPYLKRHPRILDVMRLHSLREIPYGVYTTEAKGEFFSIHDLPAQPDDLRKQVTQSEARSFYSWLNNGTSSSSGSHDAKPCGAACASNRKRAGFVAHFSWFDLKSKVQMDEIPGIDFDEAEKLLSEYFPEGHIVW